MDIKERSDLFLPLAEAREDNIGREAIIASA